MQSPPDNPHYHASHRKPLQVTFDHLTINSGHNCRHFNCCVSEEVSQVLAPLTKSGLHNLEGRFPGGEGMALQVSRLQPGHVVFTVLQEELPLVTCHACLSEVNAEAIWDNLIAAHHLENRQYVTSNEAEACLVWLFICSGKVRRPPGLFLTVHLHPGMFYFPATVPWLGSFERCFYWRLWADEQAETTSVASG